MRLWNQAVDLRANGYTDAIRHSTTMVVTARLGSKKLPSRILALDMLSNGSSMFFIVEMTKRPVEMTPPTLSR